MFRHYRALQIAGALAVLGGGSAAAETGGPEPMRLGAPAPAPIGYVEFCRREPADCPADPARVQGEFDKSYWSLAFNFKPGARYARGYRLDAPASIRRRGRTRAAEPVLALRGPELASAQPRITLTESAYAELERVNRAVNGGIRAMPDRVHHRQRDRWDLPISRGDGRGDCEDYVLEKRHQLIGLGYPAEALSIALVRTRWNETHAVLIVETTVGAYVLDSASPWVTPWSDLRYRWLVRQSPDDPAVWVEMLS